MLSEPLKQLIQQYCSRPVDQAYAAFARETGQTQWDYFLGYLYQQQAMSAEAYSYVYAQGQVLPKEAAGADASESPELRQSYRIVKEIGAGGMGTVHLAKDNVLCRDVAFKRLKPGVPGDVSGRFLDEAQVTAQLDHPNIVSVYGLEVQKDGTLGYAMKLVRGKELAELIDTRRELLAAGSPIPDELSLRTLLNHFVKVCDAIAYANSKGVIHRDLKPANIMVCNFGEVYVMDWGISRLIHNTTVPVEDRVELTNRDGTPRDNDRTVVGQSIGTAEYMSPEQAQGLNKKLDGRSDQYALGLILHEILCLKRAVTGDTRFEVLTKAVEGRPDPIVASVPGFRVDRRMRAIIETACARMPADRYASVQDLGDDVGRYVRGEPIAVRPDTAVESLYRFIGRHATVVALSVLALVAGFGSLALLSIKSQQRAEHQEFLLTEAQTVVARQAQRVDNHFLAYQERLDALSVLGSQALVRGLPSRVPAPETSRLAEGNTLAQLVDSPGYGRPIHPRSPAFHLAPGADRGAAIEQVRKLTPLGRHMRRLLLGDSREAEEAVADQMIREAGLAVRQVFFGLPDGTLLTFPGKGGYRDDYDPRKRRWYEQGREYRFAAWGSPYPDATGQGLLIPCSAPVRGSKGELLGVVALDVTVAYVAENLLQIGDAEWVRETYLLDPSGRMVVRSEDDVAAHVELTPEVFWSEEVVASVLAERSGRARVEIEGEPGAIIYLRLPTIGWYFVAWVALPD